MSLPQPRGTHGDETMNEKTDTITGDLTKRHGLTVDELLACHTVPSYKLPPTGSEPRQPSEPDYLVVENWLAACRVAVLKDLEESGKNGDTADTADTAAAKAALSAIDVFCRDVMAPVREALGWRTAVKDVQKLIESLFGAN